MYEGYNSDSSDLSSEEENDEFYFDDLDVWVENYFDVNPEELTDMMMELRCMRADTLSVIVQWPTHLKMKHVLHDTYTFENYVPCLNFIYPHPVTPCCIDEISEYDWHDMYVFLHDFIRQMGLMVPDNTQMFKIMTSVTMQTKFSKIRYRPDPIIRYIKRTYGSVKENRPRKTVLYNVAIMADSYYKTKYVLRHLFPMFNSDYLYGRILKDGKAPMNILKNIQSIKEY
jgi:hypothetical protein